ncbi:MAG: hypothetical protein CBC02_009785 [Flavobacteriaceae bacterium TMED42]|nr:MAG: hypothetical protein CBC02_009785 [Flavobacteriaceae bacterium TMED42]|tara:strand:- start:240 stop:641 length:402 start_codon:yes stop_codon:yes gene_type:complete
MSTEDLQQEVATLKAIVATQEEKIDSLVEELEKIESKNDYDLTHKCAFTDSGMIDDCGIEIYFGYGSNRDLQSFSFNNVSDGIGEKVLKFLNDLFVNGKTIRDYGHDSLGGKSEDIPLPTNETVYNAENNIQQ